MKIEQLDMAGKRPEPADRSDRSGLAATVEESYKGRSGRIEPATTSRSTSALPALCSIARPTRACRPKTCESGELSTVEQATSPPDVGGREFFGASFHMGRIPVQLFGGPSTNLLDAEFSHGLDPEQTSGLTA
jgi:hypothetical protein